MKRVFKRALLAPAAVGCWAAIRQVRQVSDLPAVAQTVIVSDLATGQEMPPGWDC